jgi:membrane carboxypeptidase/penicillin-binding protein
MTMRQLVVNKNYNIKPREISQAQEAVTVLKNSSGTRCFTGATGSERDAWMLRLGPSGSTAIWIGFDEPKKIADEKRVNELLGEFVERLGN